MDFFQKNVLKLTSSLRQKEQRSPAIWCTWSEDTPIYLCLGILIIALFDFTFNVLLIMNHFHVSDLFIMASPFLSRVGRRSFSKDSTLALVNHNI